MAWMVRKVWKVQEGLGGQEGLRGMGDPDGLGGQQDPGGLGGQEGPEDW